MKASSIRCLDSQRVIAAGLVVVLLLAFVGLPEAFAQTSGIGAYEDVSVDEAYNMIKKAQTGIVVLDVRNQSEYNLGHLYGAVLIPVYELEERISELQEYVNDPIIVYCKAGSRSHVACEILVSHGFTKVYNMLGGITAWMNAGYPIYTTFHHATVNIVNEEILLQIEPMPPISPGECPSCESEFIFVNLTVLEQEEDHMAMLLVYEFNRTRIEATITTTKVWSYAELTDEYHRTATFMKTEIAVEDEYWQFYSLSYSVQREEYVLTVYTRLQPLNPEIFETSFTEMNYAPTGEPEVVSMEFVELNSSVTLSQLYAVLGKVAKEIGKVYEKSGDETLAQLAQNYYTMEEEAKYLSKLVEKRLQKYDLEILESSVILMDHPQTCFWVLWWKVCIDWCDVLCGVLGTICGAGCESACCIAAPPLCPYCFLICSVACNLGEAACYLWCVEQFNCVIQWLTR